MGKGCVLEPVLQMGGGSSAHLETLSVDNKCQYPDQEPASEVRVRFYIHQG